MKTETNISTSNTLTLSTGLYGTSGSSGYSGSSGTSGSIGYSGSSGTSIYRPTKSFDSCLENAIKKLNLNYSYKIKYNFPKVEVIFKSKNSIFFKQKFKINIDVNDGNWPYNDKLEELLTSNIKKQIREINLNKLITNGN